MNDFWDELAKSIGYADEKEMLEDFYIEDAMSVSEIGKRLGAGTATIARRLAMAGITKRKRGGANNTGAQKHKLFHMDQRYVFSLDLSVVAKLANVSKSLVYKYRKSVTGGKISGILHNQSELGSEPVFDLKSKASVASAG